MRRAARTDACHHAIVQALRKVGCQVLDLSQVGNGCPDLLVRTPDGYWYQRPSQCVLMEIKTPRGTLTADQKRFHAAWRGVVVVRSVSEALAAVGVR